MKKVSFMLSALLLVILVGCNKESNKISIVLDWTPNTNHTGLFVAQEMGYFKEAGVEVEIIQPPEDGALPLVASQKAQFGISFPETLAKGLSQNPPLPVTSVATIMQDNTSGFISLKEKNITSMKDLEGKKVAVGTTEIEKEIIRHAMESQGADYHKIDAIPITVENIASALAHQVDVAWVYYGWDGIALALQNIPTNFIPLNTLSPSLNFYTPLLVANRTFIEENPELAKKVVKSIQKGYTYAAQNPQEATEHFLKHNPESSKALIEKSQEYLSKKYLQEEELWGKIEKDRWNEFYQWLASVGIIPTDLKDQGFTNQFIE